MFANIRINRSMQITDTMYNITKFYLKKDYSDAQTKNFRLKNIWVGPILMNEYKIII